MRILKWLMLFCIILLSSCAEKETVEVPIEFKALIEEADGQDRPRVRDVETAPVYRCYEETDGSLTVIQSVEAYEEPMLISTRLNGERILEVGVLYENETEDYGDYVTEDWFLDRLCLSTTEKLTLVRRKKEADNEVIAITGATITSEAVVVAVNKSMDIWEDTKNEKN